jgi:NADH-quinone oxidoreductase subunit H
LAGIPVAGPALEQGLKSFPLVVARFDVALLYVLGITSVGVYGIALAGWSSNNKYSLMGGLRSSAQMISYELALSMALIGVVLQSGTLDLYAIVEQQYGIQGLGWNIFWVQPLGFVIYPRLPRLRNQSCPFRSA